MKKLDKYVDGVIALINKETLVTIEKVLEESSTKALTGLSANAENMPLSPLFDGTFKEQDIKAFTHVECDGESKDYTFGFRGKNALQTHENVGSKFFENNWSTENYKENLKKTLEYNEKGGI